MTPIDDPTTYFVQAVFEQAIRDSQRGDRDAHQWLARDAELWLKALGLGVTRGMTVFELTMKWQLCEGYIRMILTHGLTEYEKTFLPIQEER